MPAPSPFASRLIKLIESQGAIPVASFMALANAHYYGSRDPLGQAGDFITAPEISQMFGELIGLWLADLWLRANSPPAAIVELGPGRGTLMADARRSMARVPGLQNLPVHFVETSPPLRAAQAERIPMAQWHDDLATLPTDCALLVIANEFFDALPFRQFVRTPAGWRERLVAVKAGQLAPVPASLPADTLIPARFADAPVGSILETSPAGTAIAAELAARLAAQGGAALVIDYGYEGPAIGDTLQAVKAHRPVNVFQLPGEVDLTAHVDFQALGAAAGQNGVRVHGPAGQGALLNALGIAQRAAALKQANPARAGAIDAGMNRLTAPGQMGELFKAMALLAPGWPAPAGFQDQAYD